jgi:hypothetical protein
MSSEHEEDTSTASDTYLSEVSPSIISQENIEEMCPEPSVVTLENYTKKDVHDIFSVMLQTSSGKYKDTGLCMTRTELAQSLAVDKEKIENLRNGSTDPPKHFMSIAIPPRDNNKTGIGYKPTKRIVVQLNLQSVTLFVTLGSIKRLLTEDDKVWYAVKMFGGKRRRIGNLAGMALIVGANHAQVPGFHVYKLATAQEVRNGVNTNEDLSDYFLDDQSLEYYGDYKQYLLRIYNNYIEPKLPPKDTLPATPTSDSELDDTELTVEQYDTNEYISSIPRTNETRLLGQESIFASFGFQSSVFSIQMNFSFLYAVDNMDGVKVWDLETRPITSYKFRTRCPVFVDGKLYYACKNKIKVRSLDSRQPVSSDTVLFQDTWDNEIVQFEVHKHRSKEYAIIAWERPTGNMVVTIVDLTNRTGHIISMWRSHLQPFLYNDGKVYIGTARSIKVYDVHAPEQALHTFPFPAANKQIVRMVVEMNKLIVLFHGATTLSVFAVDPMTQELIIAEVPSPGGHTITDLVMNGSHMFLGLRAPDEARYYLAIGRSRTQYEKVEVSQEISQLQVFSEYVYYNQGNMVVRRPIKSRLR